jgi:hypothetical protein
MISQNLNYVFDMCRFHTGLGLHEISMLLIWTCLVLGLLKFLVLVICLFFLHKVDPHHTEGGRDAPKGSSSLRIGESWPDIHKLDEVNHRATIVGDLPGGMLHERSSSLSAARVNEHANPVNKWT